MKPNSVVGARLAAGLFRFAALPALPALPALAALAGLGGCYASEKIGKDIQDVSHDVNQGGIYMHHGALSVYRPERRPQPTTLTNASMTTPAAPAPAAVTPPPAPAEAAPQATPEWQPPPDGSEALPKKDGAPAAPAAPAAAPAAPTPSSAPAADAGVYSM